MFRFKLCFFFFRIYPLISTHTWSSANLNWPNTTPPTVSTVYSWFKCSTKFLSLVTGTHTFPLIHSCASITNSPAHSSVSLQKIPAALAARSEAVLEILCVRAVIGGRPFMTRRALLYCICPCSPHLPSYSWKKTTPLNQHCTFCLSLKMSHIWFSLWAWWTSGDWGREGKRM